MSIQQAHSIVSMGVKNLNGLKRFLKKTDARTKKALRTAIKVEAFRLKKLLQKEIRSGVPGGKSMAPLSYIAKRKDRQVKTGGGTTVRQSPNRHPMARMAVGVRYRVKSYKPFAMSVGFVAPPGKKGHQLGTWALLAIKHSKGFTTPISQGLRKSIIDKGGRLGKAEGGSTPFFLKRKTQKFTTPARPIVIPFWMAHRMEAPRNVKRNFKLKMKGRRI